MSSAKTVRMCYCGRAHAEGIPCSEVRCKAVTQKRFNHPAARCQHRADFGSEYCAKHKPRTKRKPLPPMPPELFDGNSVLWEMRSLFPAHKISGETVSDVLDAVVSLIRKRAPRTAKRGRFTRRAC